MRQLLLWVFFVADVLGVLWCVRTLAREAVRWSARRRDEQAQVTHLPVLELPEDFVLVPAQRLGVRLPETSASERLAV